MTVEGFHLPDVPQDHARTGGSGDFHDLVPPRTVGRRTDPALDYWDLAAGIETGPYVTDIRSVNVRRSKHSPRFNRRWSRLVYG